MAADLAENRGSMSDYDPIVLLDATNTSMKKQFAFTPTSVEQAKAWQEKDDRVQIIDVKARSSEGPRGQYVLTSAYIGFLLPMMVELQHLYVDLA